MNKYLKKIAIIITLVTVICTGIPVTAKAADVAASSVVSYMADAKSTENSGNQVSISQSLLTLTVGKKKTLKLNGADGEIKWRSSDKSVAKVSSKGKVTAKAEGEAIIVAIYNDEVYTCIVDVKPVEEKKELSSIELFELSRSSMVEISIITSAGGDSLGSGFFIDKNKILTNYHVIENASSITVKDYNGKEYTVKSIYDYDATYDIAVIGVKQDGIPLDIATTEPVTGETVYTIGSPYGYTGTFSKGIVSLATRTMDAVDYIQITAPLSRGNSGGPLINKYGEVIGVNTLSQLEGQNINFSVKIKYLNTLDLTDAKKISTFLKKAE